MAKQRASTEEKEIILDFGEVSAKQQEFLDADSFFVCYGGAKGGGKATTNDTLICTPHGWVKMGDIKVGDTVTGADGKGCKVLGVYPQGNIPVYKVTFADGAEIRVSGEHLWKIRITGNPRKVNGKRVTRDNWEVISTADIVRRMDKLRSNQSVVIPLSKPVEWDKKELPIKPYTVGALLGDGCIIENGASCNCSITTNDIEVIERIRADGYEVNKYSSKYSYGIKGIRQKLINLGLCENCYNKRIPEIYLSGSIEDRLELLRGLMDTDGYADTRGHTSYSSVSRTLADNVQYLVRSLGGKASVSKKNRKSGLSYEVNIRMPDVGISGVDIFSLQRQKDRCAGKLYNGGISDVTRRIISIEPDGEEECTCIRVDNEEHLFIAENFIVTHNSHIIRLKAAGMCLHYPGIRILMIRCH